MRYDLFISYASDDRKIAVAHRQVAIVSHLKRLLEKHRVPKEGERRLAPFRVCTYEDDFDLGKSLPDEIRAQLDQSACLLVVCSHAAASSEYVRLEVDHFTRNHGDRPVVAGQLNLAPHLCFPDYFLPHIIVADLRYEEENSVEAWKRKVESESHKVVAASVKLPVSGVYDRFTQAQRKRHFRTAFAGIVFLVVALLAGWQYRRYRSEVDSRDARLFLQTKGVAFEPWRKQGLWVRAYGVSAFGDSDLFRLNPVHGIVNLELGRTSITDNGLRLITRHTELTVLGLGFTKVTPSRLSELRVLKRLERLDLTGIPATDGDIEFLPALSSLSDLTLNGTRITDRGVEVIANLHELSELNLELTAVGDVGVARLRSLKRLEWLGLDGTRVTDNALPNLAALPLKALGLNSTAVSDHSVQILMRMTDLEQLWIGDTAISFKEVLQLSGLKHLRRLVVHRDQFSRKQLGSLEESFGARLVIVDWDRRRN